MSLDPRVDVGHVHLKVADLDRALGFWRDTLGFEEQARMGDQAEAKTLIYEIRDTVP